MPSDGQSGRRVARMRIDESRFPVAALDMIEAEGDIPQFAWEDNLAIRVPPQTVDSVGVSDLLDKVLVRWVCLQRH